MPSAVPIFFLICSAIEDSFDVDFHFQLLLSADVVVVVNMAEKIVLRFDANDVPYADWLTFKQENCSMNGWRV